MRAFPRLRDFLFRLRYGFRGVPFAIGQQEIRLDESLRRWDNRGESAMQNIFLERLRPGDCMVDVGANFGLHSLLAGKLVGPTGQVHAFEPLSANLEKLRHHVALNHLEKIVQVVPSAVSDLQEKELSFFSGAEMSGLTASLVASASNTKQQRVANTRLDDFAAGIKRPVQLVKIDVEGAELSVLRGGRDMLRRDRPILVVEVHIFAFADFKTSLAEYRDFLTDAGYEETILPGTTLRSGELYQALYQPRGA